MPVTDSASTLFTRYGPAELDGVREDLLHLRDLDGGTRGPDTGNGLQPGCHVVTARIAGRLAGYVAGVLGEVVDVRDIVVAGPVRRSHPALAGTLVEEFVERAALPWADVVLPRDPAALAHLIATGWSPVADGAAEGRGAVRLSGARGIGA